MAGQNELEIYRQHMAAKQKYAYFLLAAVGACVGFALTQTKDASIHIGQIPLAIGLAAWALSFWCGCKHLTSIQATMYTNLGLLKLKSGRDPIAGTDLELVAYGVGLAREAVNDHATKAGSTAQWQFRWFIVGVCSYIVWHVLEMASRTDMPELVAYQ